MKDTKRRQDTDELTFLVKKYLDQLDDDAELGEVQDMYLHSNENTEANCRENPIYRFGDPEPTMTDKSKKSTSGTKNAPPKSSQKK